MSTGDFDSLVSALDAGEIDLCAFMKEIESRLRTTLAVSSVDDEVPLKAAGVSASVSTG